MSGADLEQAAGRAVEAALSAGAGDAEAWAERSVEREIRVYEGAVESLTDAAASGIGIRSFSDGRWGYAYGTDLSSEGRRKLAEAAAGAAAIADPDEDAGMPDEFGAADVGSLASPRLAEWDTAVERFSKIMPCDYRRVLEAAAAAEAEGRDVNEAIMAASQG